MAMMQVSGGDDGPGGLRPSMPPVELPIVGSSIMSAASVAVGTFFGLMLAVVVGFHLVRRVMSRASALLGSERAMMADYARQDREDAENAGRGAWDGTDPYAGYTGTRTNGVPDELGGRKGVEAAEDAAAEAAENRRVEAAMFEKYFGKKG